MCEMEMDMSVTLQEMCTEGSLRREERTEEASTNGETVKSMTETGKGE